MAVVSPELLPTFYKDSCANMPAAWTPHRCSTDKAVIPAAPHMSAFGGKADMTFCAAYVCF